MLKIHPEVVGRTVRVLFCLYLGLSAQFWKPQGLHASETLQGGLVGGCLDMRLSGAYRGIASLWDSRDGRIPDPRKFIIIPSAITKLEPDGCFSIETPPGRYVVGAVVRKTPGPTTGPPRAGDLVCMTPGVDGGYLQVDVAPAKIVDIGVRSDCWQYGGFDEEIRMGVRGKVVDQNGRPVAGLLVFAFADSTVNSMPLAVSGRTAADGSYQLRTDRPGEIFLRAKADFGKGTPGPGEHIGVYGGATAKPVMVESGKVVDLGALIVLRVPEEMTGRFREDKPTDEPSRRNP